ncbi:MAG: lysylphosphatidylglycerol synthase transmembrane domain-containing protein [candidate division WOR-3 bacterium]
MNEACAKPHRPKAGWLGALIRVGLALVLIGVLIVRIDAPMSWQLIRSCRPWFVLLGFGFYLLLFFLCNLRWRVLLQSSGERFSGWFLFRVYLASTALNAVLPTALGGDVLRVAWTAKGRDVTRMVSVVLVDRLLGLVGLLLLSSLASVSVFVTRGLGGFALVSGAGLTMTFLLLLGIFWEPVYRPLAALVLRLRLFGVGARIVNVTEEMRSLRKRPAVLISTFLLSLAVWVVHSLVWFVLGQAVGAGTGITDYFVFVPLVALATMMPVSVGGVGVRENSFVFLMTRVGMAQAQAGSIALLFLGTTYLYALIGAAVLLGLRRSG